MSSNQPPTLLEFLAPQDYPFVHFVQKATFLQNELDELDKLKEENRKLKEENARLMWMFETHD